MELEREPAYQTNYMGRQQQLYDTKYVSLLLNTAAYVAMVLHIVRSFGIFNTFSVLVCPAGKRLSGTPPPRDRDTLLPHGNLRCSRRKNRCPRQTRRAGEVETCPPGDELFDPRDGDR